MLEDYINSFLNGEGSEIEEGEEEDILFDPVIHNPNSFNRKCFN